MKYITTENPITEQWEILSQYSFRDTVRKFAINNNLTFSNDDCNFITSRIRQAKAYFQSAESAPLDISPLLVYYGTINLLSGIAKMIDPNLPGIKGHGMTLIGTQTSVKIADIKVKANDPSNGGLQHFCNAFSDGIAVCNTGEWQLEDIFSSIPDMTEIISENYASTTSFVLPIEDVKDGKVSFQRIRKNNIRGHNPINSALDLVIDLKSNYLPAQTMNDFVILYPKPKCNSKYYYSTTGIKYLPLAHNKREKYAYIEQIIFYVMASFCLGYLSRYHPELWNPLIQDNEYADRLIIEKFISLSKRYIPNLAINYLLKERVQFGYMPMTTEEDYFVRINDDKDIERIVKNIIRQEKSR